MPDTDFQNALRDAVQEVLEKMFFAQPSDSPDEVDPSSPVLAVKLTFEGSPPGALTLVISDGAARQIAADFLGQEQSELTPPQIGEVACELANMICGSVLSRMESRESFRLSSPRLLLADQWRYRAADAARRITHTVRIDSGSLTATVETLCPAVEKSVF